jgi:hypothetical protein
LLPKKLSCRSEVENLLYCTCYNHKCLGFDIFLLPRNVWKFLVF